MVKNNIEKVIENIEARIRGICDELAAKVPECPFMANEVIVKIGHPVEEILKLADHYDLVVMGSHGRGILADAMMGSTSRRVLRRCPKPVLIVRLPETKD
jgi:nucleotide-binding universal stress UspA family protein